MLSSIVWLVLIQTGRITSNIVNWSIYIPVTMFECALYFKCMQKVCDRLEKKQEQKK